MGRLSGKNLPKDNQQAARSPRRYRIPHRHKAVEVVITEDDALELYLDGCLRKRRAPGAGDLLYVWTNVELLWEEHHYIEARYFRGAGQLKVTVNGEPLFEAEVGE